MPKPIKKNNKFNLFAADTPNYLEEHVASINRNRERQLRNQFSSEGREYESRLRDASNAYDEMQREFPGEESEAYNYATGRSNRKTSFGTSKQFRDAQQDLMENGTRRVGFHKSLDDVVDEYASKKRAEDEDWDYYNEYVAWKRKHPDYDPRTEEDEDNRRWGIRMEKRYQNDIRKYGQPRTYSNGGRIDLTKIKFL